MISSSGTTLLSIFFLLGIIAKGVWLFLPIGIMLTINTIMFTLTVIMICKLDKKKRELNIRTGNRDENMEM